MAESTAETIDRAPRDARSLRSFLLAMLLLAAVVIPRSILVADAHSESSDDEYHLMRGLMFWRHEINADIDLNDPPFGEGVLALPMLAIGADYHNARRPREVVPTTQLATYNPAAITIIHGQRTWHDQPISP